MVFKKGEKIKICIVATVFLIISFFAIITPSITSLNSIEINNSPPIWVLNRSNFSVGNSLVINLNNAFFDADNHTLVFSFTHKEEIDQKLENNILILLKNQENQNIEKINTTVFASDGYSVVKKVIWIFFNKEFNGENNKEKNESKNQEIIVKNTKIGKQIEDDPKFTTVFINISKNLTNLLLSFYHNSSKNESINITGNINYSISKSVSKPFEIVDLNIILQNNIIPKFKLKIGDASDIFEFGKKIPNVEFYGNISMQDRTDEKINILINDENITILIYGPIDDYIKINKGKDKGKNFITDVIYISNSSFENASISLKKIGETTAVLKCDDFDSIDLVCKSEWKLSNIPFSEDQNKVLFNTNEGNTAYVGTNITILNVQSFPTFKENWTVNFTTFGKANLSIKGFNGTLFNVDINFSNLKCGNQKLEARYDESNNIFYPNYKCDETGSETSTTITGGKHTLEFKFGDASAYAYNQVCGEVITSSTTMTGNIGACAANGINFGADNIIFDCAGFTITGQNAANSMGINISIRINATVKNCLIRNFSNGIEIRRSNDSLIQNVSVFNNTNGIVVQISSNRNLVANSTVFNNTGDGLQITSTVINNTVINVSAINNSLRGFLLSEGVIGTALINNTAINNSVGFRLDSSGSPGANNTFENNNATFNNIGFEIVGAITPSVVRVENNTFINNTAKNNTQIGFFITESRTTFIHGSLFIDNSLQDLNVTLSNSTIFEDSKSIKNYTFDRVGFLVFANSSAGNISFTNTSITIVPQEENLSLDVKITFNRSFINSTNAGGFNTSANISLFNISFTTPLIVSDFIDSGNFNSCPSSICSNTAYANNIFTFNVTRFTAYSLQETQLATRITFSSGRRPTFAFKPTISIPGPIIIPIKKIQRLRLLARPIKLNVRPLTFKFIPIISRFRSTQSIQPTPITLIPPTRPTQLIQPAPILSSSPSKLISPISFTPIPLPILKNTPISTGFTNLGLQPNFNIAPIPPTLKTSPLIQLSKNFNLGLKPQQTKTLGNLKIIDGFKFNNCDNETLDLTIQIPDNFINLGALECQNKNCKEIDITINRENLTGMGFIVNEIRKQEIEDRTFVPLDDFKILQKQKYVDASDSKIESDLFSIEFKDLKSQFLVELKTPEEVSLPKNPYAQAASYPFLIRTNNKNERLNTIVTIPIPELINFDTNSLAIYLQFNSNWRYLGGSIDDANRTISVEIEDLIPYLNNNESTFMVFGTPCEACVNSVLEKVYDGSNKKAIFLVHGFASKPAAWQPLLDDIALNKQPWQVWTFAYPSNQSIDKNALEFAEQIEKQKEIEEIYIVAHSLGGFIVEKALNLSHNKNYNFDDKIKKIILIGVPHEGSPVIKIYRDLLNKIINEKNLYYVFNTNDIVIKDLIKGISSAPENKSYFVIAGNEPYFFSSKYFVSNKTSIRNDGITTIYGAQNVGKKQINNYCKDYYELKLTHTELTDENLARRIILRIIGEEASKTSNQPIVGYDSYIRLKIDQCRNDTSYLIFGKKISEIEAAQPLNCGCGNNVCSIDETEESCPIDCAPKFISIIELCAGFSITINFLAILLVLLMIFASIDFIRHKTLSHLLKFVFIIFIITIILIFIQFSICKEQLYFVYLVLLFVFLIICMHLFLTKKSNLIDKKITNSEKINEEKTNHEKEIRSIREKLKLKEKILNYNLIEDPKRNLILDYKLKAEENGYTIKEIKKALTDIGWPKEEVDKYLK